MDNTIIAAIIGGVCTILSPIVVVNIKELFSNKLHRIVNKNRLMSVQRKWKGMIQEKDETNQLITEYETILMLKYKSRKIFGTGQMFFKDGVINVVINGQFFDDKYIGFSYQNADPRIKHYGLCLLNFSDDAESLEGNIEFVGYDTPMSKAYIKLKISE